MKRITTLLLALLLALAAALAVPSATITDEASERYDEAAFAEED